MMPEKPTERTSLLPVAGPSRRYESNEDPEEPVNILVPTWTTLMQPEPPLGTEDPSLKSTVQIWIPCSQWLPAYNSTWLRGDLIAGLTVGIIVVPQGMAYAHLAHLPPQYGLYSALTGALTYWIFGTSKDISLGPVAVVSTVVGGVLSSPSIPKDIAREDIAASMAFMAGVIICVMSALRLGWLVEFIPVAASTAFVTGSALDIAVRQLSTLLGLTLNGEGGRRPTWAVLGDVLRGIVEEGGSADALVGVLALGQLYVMKYGLTYLASVSPKYRSICTFLSTLRAVVTLLIWTCASFFMYLSSVEFPLQILGPIPSGLPCPSMPNVSPTALSAFSSSLPALILVLLIEHLTIARSFSRQTVRPTNEFLAIGMANVVGSLGHGYPSTGSFSRTAIASKSGARTPLQGAFTAGVVMLATRYTGAFYFIPRAAMSAVIIHAVVDLVVGRKTLVEFWTTSKFDTVVFAAGLMTTLAWDVERGIYISTGISLLRLFYKMRLPDAHLEYLSEGKYKLLLGRGFTYANASSSLQRARREISSLERRGERVRVLDVVGCERKADVGCRRAVRDFIVELEGRGVLVEWEQ